MPLSVPVTVTHDPAPQARRVAEVLARQVRERTGIDVAIGETGPALVELAIAPVEGPESFDIADGRRGGVRATGHDARGLLYGAGKLLRTSRFDNDGFAPGEWRGRSAPEKPFRSIYFATHFHNFYHEAPDEEIERYIEELGLWGYNAVLVWYDMHHFDGYDDPRSLAMIERLRAILAAAKRIGLGAGLTLLGNEGYANSPAELRLTAPTQLSVRGMYGTEICPNKPGGRELILASHRRTFEAMADIGLDYLSIWPYDQGGCACDACRPWGANGFLRIAEPVARLARSIFPQIRIVLSTWLFDAFEDEGEWTGLTRAFSERPDWVDYVLADSHTTFPRYPIEHGVPGGLPLINFPEISMWGMGPWGGYGANPLPERFQTLWRSAGDCLSGGFPYSEGIFEDINKAIYSRFYWKADTPATEAVREYAAYEFSPEAADDVLRAVAILERNHTRTEADAGAQEAFNLLQSVNRRLSERSRASWRWRILYLRALLDREHYVAGSQSTPVARAAFEELIQIYHAENGEPSVRPPLPRES